MPDWDAVQQKMQPGVLTLKGFLGVDARSVADIIAADAATLHALGLTHAAIADALERFAQQGDASSETERVIDGRYVVTERGDRGVLPSPFGDGQFRKDDVTLTDRKTGETFRWNSLTVHMIREYGFYCGCGCDYRIDPAVMACVLGLQPSGQQ